MLTPSSAAAAAAFLAIPAIASGSLMPPAIAAAVVAAAAAVLAAGRCQGEELTSDRVLHERLRVGPSVLPLPGVRQFVDERIGAEARLSDARIKVHHHIRTGGERDGDSKWSTLRAQPVRDQYFGDTSTANLPCPSRRRTLPQALTARQLTSATPRWGGFSTRTWRRSRPATESRGCCASRSKRRCT